MSRLDDLFAQLRLRREPASAPDLAKALGISQPTLSRTLVEAGDTVLRTGAARATRYVLRRDIPAAGSRWPLYRIDATGNPTRLGQLQSLHGDRVHLAADRPMPAALQGEFASGVFPGFPWFLDDQRPQGFLGRAFARRHAAELAASDDVLRWNQDDVLRGLLRHGEDMAGNLVVGEAALERALRFIMQPPDSVDAARREAKYALLADAAMRGELPGSSAAGERPKFLATLQLAEGYRSVIVKFSERAGSPAAQRWADLLVCEKLASDTLRAHGIAAAENEILRSEGRTFLQSTRFDRSARLGRRGFVSLAALDASFHGHATIPWWRYATQLERERWIDAVDAQRLRVLSLFGMLIGNSDMHLGNVALEFADRAPFALCPAYDMLPMLFAPAGTGEVVPREYQVPLPLPENRDAWRAAAPMAADFWQRVQSSDDISKSFQAIARQAGESLATARERTG